MDAIHPAWVAISKGCQNGKLLHRKRSPGLSLFWELLPRKRSPGLSLFWELLPRKRSPSSINRGGVGVRQSREGVQREEELEYDKPGGSYL